MLMMISQRLEFYKNITAHVLFRRVVEHTVDFRGQTGAVVESAGGRPAEKEVTHSHTAKDISFAGPVDVLVAISAYLCKHMAPALLASFSRSLDITVATKATISRVSSEQFHEIAGLMSIPRPYDELCRRAGLQMGATRVAIRDTVCAICADFFTSDQKFKSMVHDEYCLFWGSGDHRHLQPTKSLVNWILIPPVKMRPFFSSGECGKKAFRSPIKTNHLRDNT